MNAGQGLTSKASQSKSCRNSDDGDVSLEREYVGVDGEYGDAMADMLNVNKRKARAGCS